MPSSFSGLPFLSFFGVPVFDIAIAVYGHQDGDKRVMCAQQYPERRYVQGTRILTLTRKEYDHLCEKASNMNSSAVGQKDPRVTLNMYRMLDELDTVGLDGIYNVFDTLRA